MYSKGALDTPIYNLVSINFLIYKTKFVISPSRRSISSQIVHACTQEAETVQSQAESQSGIYSETLSQN